MFNQICPIQPCNGSNNHPHQQPNNGSNPYNRSRNPIYHHPQNKSKPPSFEEVYQDALKHQYRMGI